MSKSSLPVALAVVLLFPTLAAASPPPAAKAAPALTGQAPSLQAFLGSLSGKPALRAATTDPGTCGPYDCSLGGPEYVFCNQECERFGGWGWIGLQCCTDCTTYCNCTPNLVLC